MDAPSTLQIDHSEVELLRAFHTSHFPGQAVPSFHGATNTTHVTEDTEDTDDPDDLGTYNDGVRRTLTDEQVKMFRHSEIQRLLLARRLQREKDEEDLKRRQKARDRATVQKRRFDDEPGQDHPVVDTLAYDDEPAMSTSTRPSGQKKFMWPELGK
jgi:hypothetical protein